jgi:hypothetical protein
MSDSPPLGAAPGQGAAGERSEGEGEGHEAGLASSLLHASDVRLSRH